MPQSGKVIDPDTENSHLTIGEIETMIGTIPFINTSTSIEAGQPVMYNVRNYHLGPIAVLPPGWDDLHKGKWRNQELHAEWKRNGPYFEKLGINDWASYKKYK